MFSPEPPGGAPQVAHRIHTLLAYIATDSNGKEDIATFEYDGKWFPMVFIDEARIKTFQPHVEKLRRDGAKVVLARFTVRTDLEDTV